MHLEAVCEVTARYRTENPCVGFWDKAWYGQHQAIENVPVAQIFLAILLNVYGVISALLLISFRPRCHKARNV
jgi:hypothetical protein